MNTIDVIGIEELIGSNRVDTMQLPDPELLDYYRFAKYRMYYIDSEIDGGTLFIQRAIILHNMADKDIPVEERRPIKIFINSPGGYLTETLAICQTILASKTPVYTINVGDCLSGAALLLIAGHKRFALKCSTALIHSGSGGTQGTYEQTKEQQKNYDIQIARMGAFILEHTMIDDKTWKKNKSKEWYLTDAEQLSYGVVDAIIESIDDVI